MTNYYLIAAAAVAVAGAGVFTTRLYYSKQRSDLIAKRMRELSAEVARAKPSILVASRERHRLELKVPVPTRILYFWEKLLHQNAMSCRLPELAMITVLLAAGSALLASQLGAPPAVCPLIALVAGSLPTFWLIYRRSRLREKFVQQLPSAIDLMISVLKSGHSIPQSVQAVAEEIPTPCGEEFSDVLHRLNLGQSLAGSLLFSAQRMESFDLDLITRAVAIQSEVGGSLGELLDKTNNTIRHRIKLARQVKALTAQSRLTAIIVGVMPFVLAFVLQGMSPGYLTPLFQTDTGRMLLTVAAVLQVLGVFIMTRLSAVKV